MFGDLTAAFGLTVLFCLAPSLIVSLAVAPLLLRVFKPKPTPNTNTQSKGKNAPAPKRGFLGTVAALAQWYFISLVVIITASIVFWWGFIAFSGGEATVDFAETLPVEVERETIETLVEPADMLPTEQAP